MRILVVRRAWVEWIINLSLCEDGGPADAGPFFAAILIAGVGPELGGGDVVWSVLKFSKRELLGGKHTL